MRKRPQNLQDEPLDIFNDERFTSAWAGATGPVALAPATPRAPSPAAETPQSAPPGTTPREPGPGRTVAVAAHALPEANVPLKFRVPQSLRSEFHRFKAELAAVLGGIALDDSNLARPLVELFLVEQSERILKEASAFRGQIKRPPNGDAVGMAEFDHAIGNIFRRASRRRSSDTTSMSSDS